MIRQTILLIVVLLTNSVIAQKKEKIYFDFNWRKLPDSTNAAYIRLIEFDSLSDLSSIKDYYISGQLQMESHGKYAFSDSCKLHGSTTYYHENGFKSEKCYFINYIKTGPDTVWTETGTLFISKFYNEGKLIGDFNVFHKDGKTIKRIDKYSEGKFVMGRCFDENSNEVKFYAFEVPPEYRGGIVEMMQFIKENVVYPLDATSANVQGKVLVGFEINEKGRLVNSHIIKGVCPSIDNEALRVVKIMPNWTPGRMDGTPVKVKMTIPIKFQLNNY